GGAASDRHCVAVVLKDGALSVADDSCNRQEVKNTVGRAQYGAQHRRWPLGHRGGLLHIHHAHASAWTFRAPNPAATISANSDLSMASENTVKERFSCQPAWPTQAPSSGR